MPSRGDQAAVARAVRKTSARDEAARVEGLIEAVTGRLVANRQVRRRLPDSGRLHIDRLLPFLLLYRRPTGRPDPGTESLVTSEAAYLTATSTPQSDRFVRKLVGAIAALSYQQFGSFLLLELWSRPPATETLLRPLVAADAGVAGFAVHHRKDAPIDADLAQLLGDRLAGISRAGALASVALVPARQVHAPGARAALTAATIRDCQCSHLGVELEATYQGPDGDAFFPLVLRRLRTRLGRQLRRIAYSFAENQTSLRPTNYQVLGRRAVVKAVWQVDAQLDRLASAFDFLVMVNPVSLGDLWTAFRRSRFEATPRFRYRPLRFDPSTEKRRLYSVPIERIEDPTLAELFFQKQNELDRRLTMLVDRGTPRFVHGSMSIYGAISGELRRTAEQILERIHPTSRGERARSRLPPEAVIERARAEISHYRSLSPDFDADVRVQPDVLAGLMVTRGHLYVQEGASLPEHRVEALLQHEIGTHLVTYYNGAAQRFQLLRSGLADYEELQEGLAVLAEYLVAGLTVERVRTLAARVLGAQMVMDGASFIDAFRLICRYGFADRAAFGICVRLYRGGGFTKDLIYLRGLTELSSYLADGGAIEPLLVGKIALRHVPVIRELMARKIVSPPRLLPRFLETDVGKARFERLRGGCSVVDLAG